MESKSKGVTFMKRRGELGEARQRATGFGGERAGQAGGGGWGEHGGLQRGGRMEPGPDA